MNRNTEEKIAQKILFFFALFTVVVIFLIGIFMFKEGMPILLKYGVSSFIFGSNWNPLNGIYGIAPMIIGTIFVTVIALLIGAPTGIAVAVFLAEIGPNWLVKIIRPAVEFLAAIPSVIYGLFGLIVIRGMLANLSRGPLQDYLPANYQTGYSILAAGIVLAIMILPTVINISEDAIRAVPDEYKEGALALGSSKWQTIYNVILPAAKSGVLTSIVLGTGRALGETMAVIMVIGNTVLIPELSWKGLFAPARTLTGNIALEMGYAGPEHQQALFATGIVLFVFIMILNIITTLIAKRGFSKI